MIALALSLALCASPRLALAVGSNTGAEGHEPLWFAETDAQRFADTLVELGQFDRAKVTVLKSPSAGDVIAALRALAAGARAQPPGETPLVIFYYSGHANPQGLELGGELFLYSDLIRELGPAADGVQIAIIDACHSGTLTRVKGAQPAPLDFEVVREPHADGVAIITSSSATEQAQESAELQGSFFTHHLIAGLRGAADSDGDGRVTLTESYRYAYHRTLAATSEAGATPQHATWAMRMSGRGEVVLVDLRQAHSLLAFSAGAGRRYLVTQERTQEVVAEVATGEDALKVALPPGRYRVERLAPAPRLAAVIELASEGGAVVDDSKLVPVPAVAARAKGEASEVRRNFVGAEVWVGSPLLHNFGAGYGVGLGYRHDFPRISLLAGLSYSQKSVDDVGFNYQYQAGTLSLAAAYRFELGAVSVLAGLKATGAYAVQTSNGTGAAGLVFGGGPIAGIAMRIVDHLAVRVLAAGTANTLKLNDAQVVRFAVELAVAVEWAP